MKHFLFSTRWIPFSLLLACLLMSSCIATRSGMLNRAFQDEAQESQKLIRAGHYRQAVDDLSMLLEMDPKNEKCLFLRGLAFQKWERYSEAIQDYQKVIGLNAHTSKAYYNLGMIYAFQLNDPPKALAAFDNFLSMNPHHKLAFTVAKLMASLDPSEPLDNPKELDKQVLLETDLDAMRGQLLATMEEDPHSPTSFYLIGRTYEAEEKNREAIRYYRAALEKSPTCARCHRSLGNLLIQGKHSKEGEIHLVKAQLFGPNEE